MKIRLAAYTDIGIQKQINQDSLMIEEAKTSNGKIVLAVICDGLGGLTKGELASAVMVRAFQSWFHIRMPIIVETNFAKEQIQHEWEMLVQQQNLKLLAYSREHHLKMGTTLLALLVTEAFYLVMSVGDSRCYWIRDSVFQVTKDHTYVQREVDMGRLTPEEVREHPRRNILLQCIGASEKIIPDYFVGQIQKNFVLMLCSDGFYHEITNQEIYQYLCPKVLESEAMIQDNLHALTETAKQRGECDNISVLVIQIC